MIIFGANQAHVILESILLGAFLGFIYEIFSFFHYVLGVKKIKLRASLVLKFSYKFQSSRKKQMLLFLLDFAYFALITPLCAIFLYGINFGIIRWYIVAFALVGFICFRLTIGYLTNRVSQLVALICRFFLARLSGRVKKIADFLISKIHIKDKIKKREKR